MMLDVAADGTLLTFAKAWSMRPWRSFARSNKATSSDHCFTLVLRKVKRSCSMGGGLISPATTVALRSKSSLVVASPIPDCAVDVRRLPTPYSIDLQSHLHTVSQSVSQQLYSRAFAGLPVNTTTLPSRDLRSSSAMVNSAMSEMIYSP